MSAAPAIVHDARTQWLLRRRELVTASDAAAILGFSERDTPGDVYARKLGLCEDEESWPMYYGNELQNSVGRAYSKDSGRPVRMASTELPELTVHPDLPWLAATLDGKLDGCDKTPAPADGPGAFEAKITSVGHTWGAEVPTAFQIQVQIQDACAGLKWGTVAALVSLREAPRAQDILFDKELFDLMVPKLERFHRHVQKRQPPVEDPSWFSLDSVKKLFQFDNGTVVELTQPDTMRLVAKWRGLADARLTIKDKEDEAAKELRLRMGAASLGVLPDGTFLTLPTTPGTVVAAFERSAFRTLRHTKNDPRKKKGRK